MNDMNGAHSQRRILVSVERAENETIKIASIRELLSYLKLFFIKFFTLKIKASPRLGKIECVKKKLKHVTR